MLLTTLIIKNNQIEFNKNYISAKIKDCSFYIFYDAKNSKNLSPQPLSYHQEEVALDKSHYFTAYKQNRDYYFTIESENEIYNVSTASKLTNIAIKTTKISIGFLIVIKANIINQSYLNIILYDDDYHSIFCALADNIILNEHSITLVDDMYDSMQRKIFRTFSFRDNKYCEIDRRFEYNKTSSIITQTLPYLFCEALFAKDFDFCLKFTSKENLKYFKDLIGDFEKIVLVNEIYKDHNILLLYKEKSQSIIKSFDFDISNNYINNITLAL